MTLLQVDTIELTLSPDFARLLAHSFYALVFHGVGITLVLISGGGALWFRHR